MRSTSHLIDDPPDGNERDESEYRGAETLATEAGTIVWNARVVRSKAITAAAVEISFIATAVPEKHVPQKKKKNGKTI